MEVFLSDRVPYDGPEGGGITHPIPRDPGSTHRTDCLRRRKLPGFRDPRICAGFPVQGWENSVNGLHTWHGGHVAEVLVALLLLFYLVFGSPMSRMLSVLFFPVTHDTHTPPLHGYPLGSLNPRGHPRPPTPPDRLTIGH